MRNTLPFLALSLTAFIGSPAFAQDAAPAEHNHKHCASCEKKHCECKGEHSDKAQAKCDCSKKQKCDCGGSSGCSCSKHGEEKKS